MSTARSRSKNSALLFASLGDETRLRLIARLSTSGPMSISRLTEDSTVTRQAITKHLRVLEQAGIVRGARQGRESVWQLEQRRLKEARRYLDSISRQWDNVLLRLKKFVEI
jgi:DNA-binding transcriptional ArsR family regulator